MSIVGTRLKVRERTQIADRRIMARDIGLVVRHIIAVALLSSSKFQEAIRVFGPLHIEYQQACDTKLSALAQRAQVQIQYDLAYSLTMATWEEYRRSLFDDRVYEIPPKVPKTWIRNMDQAIELDRQNSIHYAQKAIFLYLLGDIDGAIGEENRAARRAPRAASIANFSLAFLHTFKGESRPSRNQYKIGLAKKTSYDEDMIRQCLTFIEQSIRQFPDKKQLRVALGVLEVARGSKERGIQALEQFLAHPPDALELQGFVNEAERWLQRAKTERDQGLNSDQ